MKRQELQKELVTLANSFVGVHESGDLNCGPVVEMFQRVIGKAEKEPWCVAFAQYCIREIDLKFGSKTMLFATESSHFLWLQTSRMCRITKPEPGCIVVWTNYKGGLPCSTGHVGIVKELLDDELMITIEGNAHNIIGERDGVFLKHRHQKRIESGDMRLTGYLKPWIK